MASTGKVYLIGAGPGDPGLFTLKGKKILEQADVVVYDRLLGEELLAWFRPEAEKIYVGKASGDHAVPQDGINAILYEKASQGCKVARLKGGDPFVFGRGGEEALYLQERGIAFEIVPGVTSSIAVPAYAGIPVSHRDISSSFAVITGHEKPGKSESSIKWEHLGHAVDTMVFLMGVENLPYIRQQLLANGQDPQTPVALIKSGTLPEQRTAVGTLENIESRVAEAGITSPAVIVVGRTVALRERLQWFEKAPLFGRKIIVTRARSQASQLVESIRELGGEAVEIPAIEIEPSRDMSGLYQAFNNISAYSWLLFTSVNGVQIFFDEMKSRELDLRMLAGLKIAAIGPATAAALKTFGMIPDFIPAEYVAESIIEGLRPLLRPGERVLLPRAAAAREVLPQRLGELGILVDEIHIYRSRKPEMDEKAIQILDSAQADYLTFTSSSTVDNFVKIIGPERVPDFAGKVKTACIGPITAERARQAGFNVNIVASEYTIPGLLAAILEDLNC